MTKPPLCMHFIAKISDVFYKLENTTCNGFPVVNSYNILIGIIDRDSLIALIEK